jgi:hypothetical protein
MRIQLALALSLLTFAACADPVDGVSVADVSADANDVTTFDSGTDSVTETDTAVDTPSDSEDDSAVDAEPDRFEPTGCDAGLLGCVCEENSDCADALCVSVGFGDGRICSEFCDGSCSEPGYTCEPFNIDGREVNACFPIAAQCEPCTDLPGCGAEINVCLTLDDGAFCAGSCATHGLCPDGTSCLEIDSGGLARPVCVPDAGVCAACLDPDEDGYGIGHECAGPDCRQDDDTVYEGAPELCDGRDNDCDLELDEGFDLRNDAVNCGACGVVCTAENAAPACVGGVCGLVACLEGFADCNEDASDGCESDLSDPVLCGVCGPLEGRPGDPCGTCGSGSWACADEGAVLCDGDLGPAAVNACGGCGELDDAPGESCGECERWVCGAHGLSCETASDELNVCGSCGSLSGEPGTACGSCDLGVWRCDGPDTACVGGSETVNACGGCAALEAEPDAPCGSCGLDSFVCDGTDAVVCDGDTAGNACDGCATLDAELGDACGPCGLDRVVCAGTDDVTCDGSTALNDCGGCLDLFAERDSPCGVCDAGLWACNGTEIVSCRGGGEEARNLCGGCSELEELPGGPCGSCGDGIVLCNGIETTLCIDAGDDPDGDGFCGPDDVCPGFDDRADVDVDTIPDGCDLCAAGDDRADIDGDGVPDACDVCDGGRDEDDLDGDGVPDICDICAGADDAVDSDGDLVPDGCDACPGGDDRFDIDDDTVPDACDVCPGSDDRLDGDGDLVPNGCDICLVGDDAVDSDGDTVPDACDVCDDGDDRVDLNGDGVPDACENDFLYVSDGTAGASGNLYRVTLDTWEVETIGPIGLPVNAMAFAPDGTLYGVTARVDGVNRRLITIDVETGAATVIAEIVIDSGSSTSGVPEITFLGGVLYGWSESGDDLIRIDTATAAATRIASSQGTSRTGLSAGPDGQLYLIPRGVRDQLQTVDPATGVTTAVVTLLGSAMSAKGMEWVGDTLYVAEGETRSELNPTLSVINTATGEVTPVPGGPVLSPDLGAIAYQN